MNSGVQNLVISLGVMQVARKIPFDEPDVLLYVRIGYVVSQIAILSVYYYISYKIKQKNDQTVLKYVEAPNPMSQEPGKLVTTTYKDYDLAETSKLLRSAYLGILMMCGLHGYLGYTQPLFAQGIMGLKNLYDAKPVSIYILGREAEGDLKRPFKGAASMFGGAGGPATDAASIAEAEKRVGSKKDE
ncbi:hypothetical protein PILCRDRAFT_827832 [Piloderma croceum F 1598]|uniref:Inorganic phosphate transporter n=1 Tax=Piloderma croceum (strain F 1598) TaxID=765440 RepID=A0A0C3F4D1_PILCF|nr:hypothetical protein PILCRDRAFT_827832 [Piloderma croceum F 1598]